MKILFIEDNYFSAKLGTWLEDYGFAVCRAVNLIEADELLETRGPFDAVIVDLDMDKRYLPMNLREFAQTQYAGWVYYNHVLRKVSPLDKNVIIVSALILEFKNSISKAEYEGLVLIDKRDSDYHRKVLNELKRLNGEKVDELDTGSET